MHKAKRLLAACMALVVSLSLFSPAVLAEGDGTQTPQSDKQADAGTYNGYLDSLGENTTRYDGRIWTDKTVTAGDITFSQKDTGETETVALGDSDFLVTYSALATSTREEQTAPVDVVFVLDFSASMNWGVGKEEVTATESNAAAKEASRLYSMVNALNTAVERLVETNEDNRIGVVVFNGTAQMMMELTTAKEIQNKVNDGNYFEVTSFTLKEKENVDDKQEADAEVTCHINDETIATGSGTNIQAGLYEGMKMLENEQDTTVNVEGTEVVRVPNVILMSDGAPTTFVSATDATYYDESDIEQTGSINKSTDISDSKKTVQSGKWWENLSSKEIGTANNSIPDGADGFMALLTAAYGKEQITQHYYGNDADEDNQARVYTIGFSTDNQTDEMVAMANLVLNPNEELADAENSSVSAVKEVWTAWNDYSQNKEPVVHAPLGSSNNSTKYDYTVAIAPNNNPASLNYTDGYYKADDEGALDQAFSDIVNSIISSAKMPTDVSGTGDPLQDGYLTYTDPLGRYMKLDDVKAILWNGTLFDEKTTTNSGDGTVTYTFTGEIQNPAYTEDNNVSNILITLKTDGETGNQTLEIKIPAAAIPLRVNTVKTVGEYSLTNNNALPVRIVYGVSVDKNVLTENGLVDSTKIDTSYLEEHLNAEGRVAFYSNLYSGTSVDENTVGDAIVTFTPAKDNPFYYMQEETYLYEDEKLKTPVTDTSLQADRTYYFQISFYGESGAETATISRTGAEFYQNYLKADKKGNVYVEAGVPRLGNLNDFVKSKSDNKTNTAGIYYYPYHNDENGEQGSGDAAGAAVTLAATSSIGFGVALGNNGSMGVDYTKGNLTISKTVEADEGLTAPDATFEFSITLTGTDGKPLTRNYTYSKEDGTTSGTISGTGTILLKDGESVTIQDLPAGTTYTVTETSEVPGFTANEKTFRGTITADTTAQAGFVNHYSAKPATLTLNGYKTINKTSEKSDEEAAGAEPAMLSMSTEESATVETAQAAPAANVMTFSADDARENTDVFTYTVYDEAGKAVGHGSSTGTSGFTFTQLEFEKPDTTYEYTIREDNGGTIKNGISYDGATHELKVNVKDDGKGQLYVESWTLDGEPGGDSTVVAFTNTYTTNVATVNLKATKNLTGRDMKAGEFEFEIVDENDTVVASGYNDENGTINFETLSYTVDDVGKTFTYTVREVSDEENNGVTYDATTYIVQVVVADDGQGKLTATASGAENMVFTNSYTAADTTVNLSVRKELEGRALTAGEFTFLLQDENGTAVEASNEADGTVNFPGITFSKNQLEGTMSKDFTFTVREETGSDSLIRYDDTVYTVIIRVQDDGQGALTASVLSVTDQNGNGAAGYTIVFHNTYTPQPVSITLNATKKLTGRTLQNHEFGFYVADAEGKLITAAPNEADGSISFTDISFDKAGTYSLQVGESIGQEAGMTYDKTVYQVTVEVTDDNGTLKADVQLPEGGLLFTNTYTEPSAPEETPKPEETPAPEETPVPEETATPAPEESGTDTGDNGSQSAATATPAPAAPTAVPAPTPAAAADAVIPQTGDESHPMLWVVLLAVSGSLAAVLAYKRRKEER